MSFFSSLGTAASGFASAVGGAVGDAVTSVARGGAAPNAPEEAEFDGKVVRRVNLGAGGVEEVSVEIPGAAHVSIEVKSGASVGFEASFQPADPSAAYRAAAENAPRRRRSTLRTGAPSQTAEPSGDDAEGAVSRTTSAWLDETPVAKYEVVNAHELPYTVTYEAETGGTFRVSLDNSFRPLWPTWAEISVRVDIADHEYTISSGDDIGAARRRERPVVVTPFGVGEVVGIRDGWDSGSFQSHAEERDDMAAMLGSPSDSSSSKPPASVGRRAHVRLDIGEAYLHFACLRSPTWQVAHTVEMARRIERARIGLARLHTGSLSPLPHTPQKGAVAVLANSMERRARTLALPTVQLAAGALENVRTRLTPAVESASVTLGGVLARAQDAARRISMSFARPSAAVGEENFEVGDEEESLEAETPEKESETSEKESETSVKESETSVKESETSEKVNESLESEIPAKRSRKMVLWQGPVADAVISRTLEQFKWDPWATAIALFGTRIWRASANGPEVLRFEDMAPVLARSGVFLAGRDTRDRPVVVVRCASAGVSMRDRTRAVVFAVEKACALAARDVQKTSAAHEAAVRESLASETAPWPMMAPKDEEIESTLGPVGRGEILVVADLRGMEGARLDPTAVLDTVRTIARHYGSAIARVIFWGDVPAFRIVWDLLHPLWAIGPHASLAKKCTWLKGSDHAEAMIELKRFLPRDALLRAIFDEEPKLDLLRAADQDEEPTSSSRWTAWGSFYHASISPSSSPKNPPPKNDAPEEDDEDGNEFGAFPPHAMSDISIL